MKTNDLCASMALASVLLVGSVNGQGAPDLPADGPQTVRVSAADISLSEAVNRAIAENRALDSARQRINAATARARQATIFPNPELDLEYENFGGHAELSGFDGAEGTISISQPLQFGGSRARRSDMAEAEVQIARVDLELHQRDVTHRTTTAFFELLAAQQALDLAEDLLELAQDLGRTVEARVEAGRVSPVEATRARIETARAAVALSDAQHRVNQNRIQLATMWNRSDPDFRLASGRLPSPKPLPPLSILEQRLAAMPEIVMKKRGLDLRTHALELEKALAVPDLTVSVGSRHFRDSGQSAWVAGLSLPIPVFDRNQGNRDAAEFEVESATRQIQAMKVEQAGKLRILIEKLLATEAATRSMAEVVEPAASESFSSVELGYQEGKFSFADLLQAQQALFEARRLTLESRLAYALVRCDLERLVGPISTGDNTVPSKSPTKESS